MYRIHNACNSVMILSENIFMKIPTHEHLQIKINPTLYFLQAPASLPFSSSLGLSLLEASGHGAFLQLLRQPLFYLFLLTEHSFLEVPLCPEVL